MPTIEVLLQGFSLGTDQGNIAFCGVTLVRGAKTILVDSAHNGRRQLLLQRLSEHGLTPADIDYVFLTHAHWDHVLNVDLFPQAKVLIHPVERDYCKHPQAHGPSRGLLPRPRPPLPPSQRPGGLSGADQRARLRLAGPGRRRGRAGGPVRPGTNPGAAGVCVGGKRAGTLSLISGGLFGCRFHRVRPAQNAYA